MGKIVKIIFCLIDENSFLYGVDYFWIMSNEKVSFWGYLFINL